MILTITANPTIDRVIFVHNFAMQDIVRAEREVISPSGKGNDVALVLHALGAPTLAISLNAGYSGQMMTALMADRGLPCRWIAAGGETRFTAVIVDVADGRQSTILAPTLHAGPEHLEQLVSVVVEESSQSWGVVCAGSLPPGLPSMAWAELLQAGRAQGLITLLDSSGVGLRYGLAGLPHILKINGRELGELCQELDIALPTWHAPDALGELATFLHGRLGQWASDALVVTFGAQGALAVTVDEAIYAPAPQVPFVSAAGAGDAVAAGLMLARRRGQSWADALRLGVAAGSSVVMNEGTAVCTAAQVNDLLAQVQVRELINL